MRLNTRTLRSTAAAAAMGLWTLYAVSAIAANTEQSTPPNIVILFADDLGYGDLSSYGHPYIRTPNLDRLATEGQRWTDFYAPAPVCSPSRGALLTGRLPNRTGLYGRQIAVLFPNDVEGMPDAEYTMAEALKSKGYATGIIGKWHLGDTADKLPTRHGFDYWYGVPYSNDMDKVGGPNYRDEALKDPHFYPSIEHFNVPLMRDEEIVERPADQNTITKRYTEEAVKFIKSNRKRPFFLYLPHTAVHLPLVPGERFKGTSKDGPYGDWVQEIDWSMGKLFDALKESGVDENTLVLFTSDNGSAREKQGSNLPLRGRKGRTDEGGMRVPCVVRWPGKIPAGSVCSEVAAACDLLPTFAKLAKAELPKRKIDGKNIWRLMSGRNGAKSPHKAFYFYRGTGLRAVRSGEWKLHIGGGGRKQKQDDKKPALSLYNLSKDIGETTDVAAENEKIVQRMYKRAQAFDKALKADARPPGEVKSGDEG